MDFCFPCFKRCQYNTLKDEDKALLSKSATELLYSRIAYPIPYEDTLKDDGFMLESVDILETSGSGAQLLFSESTADNSYQKSMFTLTDSTSPPVVLTTTTTTRATDKHIFVQRRLQINHLGSAPSTRTIRTQPQNVKSFISTPTANAREYDEFLVTNPINSGDSNNSGASSDSNKK